MTIRETVTKPYNNYGWNYYFRIKEYHGNHMDAYKLIWQGDKLESAPAGMLDKEYKRVFIWENTRSTFYGIVDTIYIECH